MIAYLIHFFPLYSSTFITDEIEELRRQGARLSLFAVRRPGPADYPPDFTRFYNETAFVFPIRPWVFLRRHAQAMPANRQPISGAWVG